MLENGLNQPDAALFINRVIVGMFFVASGYNKLFDKARHATLVATLKECGIPFIGFNQWFVPLVELLGGIAVVLGLLAPLAALGMATILAVALWTDGKKRVAAYSPINRVDYICDWLYLPELLMLSMLLVVIFMGPGQLSLYALLRTQGFL